MDKKYRAGGATISAGWLATFGRELLALTPEKTIGMLGDIVSPASFYIGMVVVGAGGVIYFGWPIRKWVTRSGRFELLKDEMLNVIRAHSMDVNYKGHLMSGETRAKAEALASKLRSMGIDPPDIHNGEEWYHWLPKMVGCATAGDLVKAKKITDEEK